MKFLDRTYNFIYFFDFCIYVFYKVKINFE